MCSAVQLNQAITHFVQQYSWIHKIHNSIDTFNSFNLASMSGACQQQSRVSGSPGEVDFVEGVPAWQHPLLTSSNGSA